MAPSQSKSKQKLQHRGDHVEERQQIHQSGNVRWSVPRLCGPKLRLALARTCGEGVNTSAWDQLTHLQHEDELHKATLPSGGSRLNGNALRLVDRGVVARNPSVRLPLNRIILCNLVQLREKQVTACIGAPSVNGNGVAKTRRGFKGRARCDRLADLRDGNYQSEMISLLAELSSGRKKNEAWR